MGIRKILVNSVCGLLTTALVYCSAAANESDDDVADEDKSFWGIYKIQQGGKNGRYVELQGSKLVTAEEKESDYQNWIIEPDRQYMGNDVYQIRSATEGMKYVDAHLKTHDHRVVIQTQQSDKSQKWIIKHCPGKNEYVIQQLQSMRFMDAYEKSPFEVVTREWQDNRSQCWHISLLTDDLEFVGIEYIEDRAEIATNPPKGIYTQCVNNETGVSQPATTLKLTGSTTVTSYWERVSGVEVHFEAKAGIPKVADFKLGISADFEFTRGERLAESTEISDTVSLVVPPSKWFRATLVITESEMTVPYVISYKSMATEAVHKEFGVWKGVTVSSRNIVLEDVTDNPRVCTLIGAG